MRFTSWIERSDFLKSGTRQCNSEFENACEISESLITVRYLTHLRSDYFSWLMIPSPPLALDFATSFIDLESSF